MEQSGRGVAWRRGRRVAADLGGLTLASDSLLRPDTPQPAGSQQVQLERSKTGYGVSSALLRRIS